VKTIIDTLWRSAYRRQLIVSTSALGVCALLALIATAWAHASLSAALLDRDAQQAAWSTSSTAAANVQEVESALPQHEAHAMQLLQGGFTSAVDRVGWSEGLVATLNAMHPSGYTLEISTAQSLPLPDDLLTSYTERGLPPPEFEVNDLTLKVQGLTEDELTTLLEHAAQSGGGIVRIERCHLERRIDQQGLDTECSLRRFRIRTNAVESGS
jgi:hypothetical protein